MELRRINKNTKEDAKAMPGKLTVAVVAVKLAYNDGEMSKVPSRILERADLFTLSLKHGPRYATLVSGRWFAVVDSGASRSLFRRRGIFKQYILLDAIFVYTA